MAPLTSHISVLSALATTVLSVPSASAAIPQFALDYAPLVWIQSEDPFFPAPISSQLQYTHPTINNTAITGIPSPLTLSNLDSLNAHGGTDVALSSNDDFTKFPSWLNGSRPDASGKTSGDPSAAIIAADKGAGVVDVFYMYFYAFDRGNEVFGEDAGNHVGDWEHTAIRFQNGKPSQMWFSQHANGEAFTYNAVEKNGIRPVAYSAKGTHANYATVGKHDHTIPNLNLPFDLFLTDLCDKGTLWDPALNAYTYAFDNATGTFTAYDSQAPTAWLGFQGHWGDDELPKSDKRQHYFLDIDLTAKWVGGPSGPRDKNLGRTKVCPDGKDCIIRGKIGA